MICLPVTNGQLSLQGLDILTLHLFLYLSAHTDINTDVLEPLLKVTYTKLAVRKEKVHVSKLVSKDLHKVLHHKVRNCTSNKAETNIVVNGIMRGISSQKHQSRKFKGLKVSIAC